MTEDEKRLMRRVQKERLRRETQRARMKLETQERQPDCQATRSHGNDKWRAQRGEVVKQRKKKEIREMLQVKATFERHF